MSSNALEFSGEERFAVPPQRVYAVLTDLDRMADNIPDAVSTQRIDANTLGCTVRPGFSFLRGTMKMTIRLADLVPGREATLQIEASGIGQSLRVISKSRIEPDKDGTLLQWTAAVVERKGLVAAVSKALIQAAAGQVIRDAWTRLHQQLEA